MNYEEIKDHYKSGFWTKGMVYNAVIKGKITQEEYESIVNGAKEL